MVKKDVSYIGIFVDSFPGDLDKTIQDQHVTMAYAPTDIEFLQMLSQLGKDVRMEIIGYDNNGQNEGFGVKLLDDVYYRGAKNQHITISIANGAKAVDTCNLVFDKPIPERFGVKVGDIITGQIGMFLNRETPRHFDDRTDRRDSSWRPHPVFNAHGFVEYESLGKDLLLPKLNAPKEVSGYLVDNCLNNNSSIKLLSCIDLSKTQIVIDGVSANITSVQLVDQLDEFKQLVQGGHDVKLALSGVFAGALPDGDIKGYNTDRFQSIIVDVPQDILISDGIFVATFDGGHCLTNIDLIDTYISKYQERMNEIVQAQSHEQEEPFDAPKIGE